MTLFLVVNDEGTSVFDPILVNRWGNFCPKSGGCRERAFTALAFSRAAFLFQQLVQLYNFLGHGLQTPFRTMCRDFILPEICKPCLFLFSIPFCNLLYLTDFSWRKVGRGETTGDREACSHPGHDYSPAGVSTRNQEPWLSISPALFIFPISADMALRSTPR